MKNFFYDQKLATLIIDKIPFDTSKITIISGYIGPKLIKDLMTSITNNKSLKISKIEIYIGMYGPNMSLLLHKKLLDLYKIYHKKLIIFYTIKLVHAKMYLYKDKNGAYINKLIGSANFSSTLFIDWKEVLTVANTNQIIDKEIDQYYDWIKKHSIVIENFVPKTKASKLEAKVAPIDLQDTAEAVKIPKLFKKHKPIYNLNRNFYLSQKKIHNVMIALTKKSINKITKLINYDENIWQWELFEVMWDDGHTMLAKFEGQQKIDDQNYPLGIVAYQPHALENYLKMRIEKKLKIKMEQITPAILNKYGTSNVLFTFISDNIIYLNFKTKQEIKQETKENTKKQPLNLKIKQKQQTLKAAKLDFEKIKKEKQNTKKLKQKLKISTKRNKEIFKKIKAKDKEK